MSCTLPAEEIMDEPKEQTLSDLLTTYYNLSIDVYQDCGATYIRVVSGTNVVMSYVPNDKLQEWSRSDPHMIERMLKNLLIELRGKQ